MLSVDYPLFAQLSGIQITDLVRVRASKARNISYGKVAWNCSRLEREGKYQGNSLASSTRDKIV